MAKQSIKLKIANKPYSFSIESEKEELYRLAEREVNDYITSIKRNNFQGWTDVTNLGLRSSMRSCARAAKSATRISGS